MVVVCGGWLLVRNCIVDEIGVSCSSTERLDWVDTRRRVSITADVIIDSFFFFIFFLIFFFGFPSFFRWCLVYGPLMLLVDVTENQHKPPASNKTLAYWWLALFYRLPLQYRQPCWPTRSTNQLARLMYQSADHPRRQFSPIDGFHWLRNEPKKETFVNMCTYCGYSFCEHVSFYGASASKL